MPTDIINALDLNDLELNGRAYIIKEQDRISASESSFITSSILTLQARSKRAVLLVTFHQLLDHYHNAGLRMGVSLKKLEQMGMLKVINPMEMYLKKIFSDSGDNFLDSMLNLIRENIKNLVQTYGKQGPVCLYIDGLTHLFDLGYSLKAVDAFAKNLISEVRESEYFAVFWCPVVSNADRTLILVMSLSRLAYIVVECRGLDSGRSAEVSGHIDVAKMCDFWDPKEGVFLFHLPKIKYHYHIYDKGAKLFAPGAVGLK